MRSGRGVLAGYGLPLAGDSGQRNGIRGDGPFGIDLGVGKRFQLFTFKDQPHTLQFRAEAFNVTNYGALRSVHRQCRTF